MKLLKRITTVLAVSIFSAILGGTQLSAQSYYDSVSCTQSKTQGHQTGGLKLENFYDYGTDVPFDNVNLKAYADTDYANYHVYVTIHFRDYVGAGGGTISGFKTRSDDKNGSDDAAVQQYNPAGVDFLQPTSYAESSYGYQNDFLDGSQKKIDTYKLNITY